VNGDGFDDIITGTNAATGRSIRVFNGKDGNLAFSINAFPGSDGVGIRVAGADLTEDDRADILAGRGAGRLPKVQTFDGTTGHKLDSFFAFGSTVLGGIFLDGF